ncbi:hypothetical protein GFH30_04170 [Acinetobacter wanghuae]|uniref:Bacterial Ig domain-containing protein n=1 Tax=Acinetobacter wanghuae TaxID=2662362 RepID=A0ABX6CYM6_9GAMM|nr:Ig-like domain-containing protein [Acinetobacter wanghuae]QGA10644.1 hypothetical protein GFH30_04170 [Acinetobacter wanghuae]
MGKAIQAAEDALSTTAKPQLDGDELKAVLIEKAKAEVAFENEALTAAQLKTAADTLNKVVEDAVNAESVEDAAEAQAQAEAAAKAESEALEAAKAALGKAIQAAEDALSTTAKPQLDGDELKAVLIEKAKAEVAFENEALTAAQLKTAADTLNKVVEDAVNAESVEDAAEAQAQAEAAAKAESEALEAAKAALGKAIQAAEDALSTTAKPQLDGDELKAVLIEKAKAEVAFENEALTAAQLKTAADTLNKVVEDAVNAESAEDLALAKAQLQQLLAKAVLALDDSTLEMDRDKLIVETALAQQLLEANSSTVEEIQSASKNLETLLSNISNPYLGDVTIADDGLSISGQLTPGSKVVIEYEGNSQVVTSNLDDGRFNIILTAPLVDGQEVIVTELNGKEVLGTTDLIYEDGAVVVGETIIADDGKSVLVQGEPGASVEIKHEGKLIGHGVMSKDGTVNIVLDKALLNGNQITLSYEDIKGNTATNTAVYTDNIDPDLNEVEFVLVDETNLSIYDDTLANQVVEFELLNLPLDSQQVKVFVGGVQATNYGDIYGKWTVTLPSDLIMKQDGSLPVVISVTETSGNSTQDYQLDNLSYEILSSYPTDILEHEIFARVDITPQSSPLFISGDNPYKNLEAKVVGLTLGGVLSADVIQTLNGIDFNIEEGKTWSFDFDYTLHSLLGVSAINVVLYKEQVNADGTISWVSETVGGGVVGGGLWIGSTETLHISNLTSGTYKLVAGTGKAGISVLGAISTEMKNIEVETWTDPASNIYEALAYTGNAFLDLLEKTNDLNFNPTNNNGLTITKVYFGKENPNLTVVAEEGYTEVVGQYGSLFVAANGDYYYQAKAEAKGLGLYDEPFTLVYGNDRDHDGKADQNGTKVITGGIQLTVGIDSPDMDYEWNKNEIPVGTTYALDDVNQVDVALGNNYSTDVHDSANLLESKKQIGSYTQDKQYSTVAYSSDAHGFKFTVKDHTLEKLSNPTFEITSLDSKPYSYVIYKLNQLNTSETVFEIVDQGVIEDKQSFGKNLILSGGDYEVIMYNGSSTPDFKVNFDKELISQVIHSEVDLKSYKSFNFNFDLNPNEYGVIEIQQVDIDTILTNSSTNWTLYKNVNGIETKLSSGVVKDLDGLNIFEWDNKGKSEYLSSGIYRLEFDKDIQTLSVVSKAVNQYEFSILKEEGTYTQAKGVLLANDKYDVRTVKLQIEVNGEMQRVNTVPLSTTDGVTTVQGEFGQLQLWSNGYYIYTPDVNKIGINAIGQSDKFDYAFTDLTGQMKEATLTINIGGIGAVIKPAGETDILLEGTANSEMLVANEFNNVIHGNGGSDTLVYKLLNEASVTGGNGQDIWTDFAVGNVIEDDADAINVQELLIDQTVANINDFIEVRYDYQKDAVTVSIDRDGAGTGYEQTDLVTLTDFKKQNADVVFTSNDDLLNLLIANGQIIY